MAILLTTFTTWKPHHTSNSSDDLVLAALRRSAFSEATFQPVHISRLLPVDFELGPQRAIAHFNALQPQAVICCGMAETRSYLSLEAQAVVADDVLQTAVNLDDLIADLALTKISHDAGRFVCNTLYYRMLQHIQTQPLPSPCLFVHVPPLTPANLDLVLQDFCRIVERMGQPKTKACERGSLLT